MKRCFHCKRIVWPWQNQYLGTTPAHALCDMAAFAKDANEMLGEQGAFTQIQTRGMFSYEKPIGVLPPPVQHDVGAYERVTYPMQDFRNINTGEPITLTDAEQRVVDSALARSMEITND